MTETPTSSGNAKTREDTEQTSKDFRSESFTKAVLQEMHDAKREALARQQKDEKP